VTREEAVEQVRLLADSHVGEYCVEEDEIASVHEETRDALRTLGVTDVELAKWYL